MTLRFVVVVFVTTDMFGAHGHQIDSWFHIRAEASGLCTNMRQLLQKQVHKWNHCNLNWKCSLQPLQTSQKNQHDVQNWSRVSQIPCESNHLRIRKCHQKYQFHPRSCVIMCNHVHLESLYTKRFRRNTKLWMKMKMKTKDIAWTQPFLCPLQDSQRRKGPSPGRCYFWYAVRSNLLHSLLEVHNSVAPLTSHGKLHKFSAEKPISWAKPAHFDFLQ